MSELPANVTATTGLTTTNSVQTKSLYSNVTGSGAGHISFDDNLAAQLATVAKQQSDIVDYIRLRLGYGMIDVEADKEHFDMGIKQALIRYRQRSSNSVEESYVFLDIYPETQEYILPNYIIDVKQIFRRGIGSVTGTTASQFEPFASGYLNTYMLVAGRVGGLANYELFVDYQKLAMTMFGGFMNFTFNKVTKKITLVRKIPWGGIQGSDIVKESVLLWTYNYKPDIVLLNDPQAFPWIQDYAYALTSISIGQAREKFATIAGPQGGTTLNGTALKQEGQALLDKLDEDIKNYVDGGQPMWWITG
jgi:hypothetical protein